MYSQCSLTCTRNMTRVDHPDETAAAPRVLMISDATVHFTTSTLQFPGIEVASCRSGCGNGCLWLEDSLAPPLPLFFWFALGRRVTTLEYNVHTVHH
jgi:hypothetical protein